MCLWQRQEASGQQISCSPSIALCSVFQYLFCSCFSKFSFFFFQPFFVFFSFQKSSSLLRQASSFLQSSGHSPFLILLSHLLSSPVTALFHCVTYFIFPGSFSFPIPHQPPAPRSTRSALRWNQLLQHHQVVSTELLYVHKTVWYYILHQTVASKQVQVYFKKPHNSRLINFDDLFSGAGSQCLILSMPILDTETDMNNLPCFNNFGKSYSLLENILLIKYIRPFLEWQSHSNHQFSHKENLERAISSRFEFLYQKNELLTLETPLKRTF